MRTTSDWQLSPFKRPIAQRVSEARTSTSDTSTYRKSTLWNVDAGDRSSEVDAVDFPAEVTDIVRESTQIHRFVEPGADAEYRSLLSEQGRLARRLVTGAITDAESLDLGMIRWAIDRIENARQAEALGDLESLALLHEKLASEVTRMVEVLPVSGKHR